MNQTARARAFFFGELPVLVCEEQKESDGQAAGTSPVPGARAPFLAEKKRESGQHFRESSPSRSATQPDFSHMHTYLAEHSRLGDGWRIHPPSSNQNEGLSASWVDEAVFEDLDKTEHLEFKDIAKEISKNKQRVSAAACRFDQAKAQQKKRKAKNELAAGARPKKKARSNKKSAAQDNDDAEDAREEAADAPQDEGEAPRAAPVQHDDAAAADDGMMPPPAMAPAPPLAPPPDMAAAVEVPQAAPGARGPIMRHNGGYLSWDDVQRGGCQAIVGQIKLEALPGGRDAPVCHMMGHGLRGTPRKGRRGQVSW